MASTGLKELCFCGSGKMYEECCFIRDLQEFGQRGPSATGSWLKEAMGRRSFNSLREAREALGRVVSDRNNSPLDDFCGLSPAQMHCLLYDPFGEESPARYNLELTDFPETPFLRILKQILLGLSQGDVKMTAKGNLTVAFFQAVARSYYGEEGFREKTRWGGFRKEEDWREIHTVRLTAEMAGFFKKDKGRFRLTQKGEQVFSPGLTGKTFLDLFKAYAMKFNWAYNDRYPQLGIIQGSFLFTLFCLYRLGDEPRPGEFYADLFLRAFPMVLHEISQSHPYWRPEEEAKRCFSLRALERFAGFFGFADVRMPARAGGLPLEVKKQPFMDSWISFRMEQE